MPVDSSGFFGSFIQLLEITCYCAAVETTKCKTQIQPLFTSIIMAKIRKTTQKAYFYQKTPFHFTLKLTSPLCQVSLACFDIRIQTRTPTYNYSAQDWLIWKFHLQRYVILRQSFTQIPTFNPKHLKYSWHPSFPIPEVEEFKAYQSSNNNVFLEDFIYGTKLPDGECITYK